MWTPELKRRTAKVGAGDWNVTWSLLREFSEEGRVDRLLWVLGAICEQGWDRLWRWGVHRVLFLARQQEDARAAGVLYTLCQRVSASQTALPATEGWRVGLRCIFVLEALVQGDGCEPGELAWSEQAITRALLDVGPASWWRLRGGMAEVLFNLSHGPVPGAVIFNNLVRRYLAPGEYRHTRDETEGWRQMLRALKREGFVVEGADGLDLGRGLPPLPSLQLPEPPRRRG